MWLFLLFGCEEIDALFAGITDPDIAEALVVGVQKPEGLDLGESRYNGTGRAGVYLRHVEDGPVTGATVTLTSPNDGTVTLDEEGDGVWSSPADPGLRYDVGGTYRIERDGVELHRAEAAPAPRLALPPTLAAGAALPIDASDQDYDGLLAVVLDPLTGEELWTNAPSDADAIQALLLEDPVLAFDIPAEAFPGPGVYAVGVGGLRANETIDVHDVNSLASVMATGVVVFSAVTVTP